MLPFRKSSRRPFTTCPPSYLRFSCRHKTLADKEKIDLYSSYFSHHKFSTYACQQTRGTVLTLHKKKTTQGTDMPGQEAHLLQPMGWPFQNAHPTGVLVDSFYSTLPLQLSLSWRICAEIVTSVSTLVKQTQNTPLFC